MELELAQDLGTIKQRTKRSHFTKRGLLNSNYKRVVKYNFKKAKRRSIFAVRQRAKALKISRESLRVSMVLKVSVFVCVAILILF
ncbi:MULTISPECIES: hypothetical protein [Winogradskyella]|uniref:hypothetical protein n=1 Tax=Winogradskyella TaxID=286104 RepID=UPI0015CA6515|nr:MULTISPECIES: hypothetical protein [Winogradskyella]QXP79989.1 hypothetical protein H0I32_04975 [Winogradskyella sp. HaHa_3_26]